MLIGAGVCFAVAIVWLPLAWITRFRASGWLDWQRPDPDVEAGVDFRPMERLLATSQRMLDLWPVPVVAVVAGLILVASALAA